MKAKVFAILAAVGLGFPVLAADISYYGVEENFSDNTLRSGLQNEAENYCTHSGYKIARGFSKSDSYWTCVQTYKIEMTQRERGTLLKDTTTGKVYRAKDAK